MADKKRIGFIDEFKEFIMRGNVLDMAIGLIIGTAFTAIVKSVVNDIIMPFVGWLMGSSSFSDFRVILTPATEDAPEVAIRYGALLQTVVDFLIIGFILFIIVKTFNTFRKKLERAKEPAAPVEPEAPPADITLLTEIRDLLKDRK
ncbi:large-conductance mechanosensitive channel protein MscL [Parasphaerochaeta coccoides]|uniref:Large-conductance mechanosensitive channel n=1 Tax=Parasphaerochaeta coccoides (strain ATCC BAA-1237 / DSM 17374 / SPN1) TaxID=760011 RepID=F4GHH7_PARC1|nr:large-conductance mechanosensitive channel protein MscL [Parasphaerochaeta coccoides]AEC02566.1 Large-conductance mechanosensitive channel [Parasphaerochaeta coccoides DSM 17374]